MPLDLDTGRGLAIALLPETVLTVWAMLALLVGAWVHRDPRAQRIAGWISLAGVVMTAAVTIWLWRADASAVGLGGAIAVDPFRWAVILLVLLGAGFTIVASLDYLDREGIAVPEYHALVLFAAVGMMLLAGATDLMTMFLGLETMSVAVYVLAGINRRSIHSAEAALKYFLLGAFASAFLLYGIALVYGATGSTKLALIGAQVSAGGASSAMLLVGLALLLIGFAFKVAAVPFHMWAPDVYDGSPTPVTAFMAASVKAAAFAGLIRVLFVAFAPLHGNWDVVLWWLAVVTMVAGNLLALSQRNLKRMLAYSSVAHAGYILASVVSGSVAGAAAFLMYLTAYTVTTIGAFVAVGALGRGGERDVTTDDLAGLSESHPLLAFTLAVCMLSLLGFPGTAGFIGKWYVLTAATGAGYSMLAAILVLASVISAGYYLPVIMAMYMKPRIHDAAHAAVTLTGAWRGICAVVVVTLLLFGVWPTPLLRLAQDGSGAFRPTDHPRMAQVSPTR